MRLDVRTFFLLSINLFNRYSADLKILFPSKVFNTNDLQTADVPSQRTKSAEAAIRAFVKLAGKSERPEHDQLFSECQGLQQSVSYQ